MEQFVVSAANIIAFLYIPFDNALKITKGPPYPIKRKTSTLIETHDANAQCIAK